MKTSAIIVSAGKGQRLMEGRKKQFLSLGGKPILCHTLDKFEACSMVHSVILVVSQEDMDYCLKEIVERHRYRKVSQIVGGGKRRQDSVKNGIDALSSNVDIVVIHDGVRPFITCEMIEKSIQSALEVGASVVAVPVKETIKIGGTGSMVLKTLERDALWQVQTPQAFHTSVIKKAYQEAIKDGFIGTDDASLVERLGGKVHLLPGSYSNIKITTPEDLMLARLLLETRISPEELSVASNHPHPYPPPSEGEGEGGGVRRSRRRKG
jgi:2-C-methyl-D-erythritol 4-phosphate cytidylyltransferase